MANELKHDVTIRATAGKLTQAEHDSVVNHKFDGQVTGDILYASSATQLSRLASVAAGQPLVSQGVGVAPAYATSMGAMTFTGLVTLGAQKLSFTNGIIKTDSNYDIQLRNSGDTGYGNLRMNNLYFNSRLIADIDGGDLSAPNVDANYFSFKCRDNGVTIVEVARLQGAADPYFQATLAFRLNPIATASLPATPVEGMITYDDTVNKLKVYNGAAWETVTSAV